MGKTSIQVGVNTYEIYKAKLLGKQQLGIPERRRGY
jgi:hypothetical protein